MQSRCDVHALRPVLDVVGQRCSEAEVVERSRPQLPDQVIDVPIEAFGDLLSRRATRRRRSVSPSTTLLERDNPMGQSGQLLAELIVHLTGNPASLVLLGEDESCQQLGSRALALRTLPLGQIEMRADDANDRSIGLVTHRKAA